MYLGAVATVAGDLARTATGNDDDDQDTTISTTGDLCQHMLRSSTHLTGTGTGLGHQLADDYRLVDNH